ncbi:hypothetical protein TWF102_007110 [Orbilia oligospora]|uniref:Uncharacterized protein n=1 Tax=Orbilia oligospora TaxID=2813651 RepID=A0A7C8JIP4_ORBOL|nr:hypothetical protein TWF102_007110 [Orbilia oligospora]KAF3117272.1 hypothetical protein TWF103_007414 [Orbilia oligospora]KAF3140790.1 hypothetical protein TWF594_006289 [Orbilia oligospora]
MDGITTIESFFELYFFSPLAETRLRKICFSRMPVLTARSTEFLDTRDLKDLRLCLCENTTVFLSSLALRGKLRLDTVIINGVCESLTGINSFLSTIQPGLRFLVYHVDIYPNIQGVLNPYDGSEFPFSRDIISRHRDTLRYLSHGVNYRNIIWFQPPEQADNVFESQTSVYRSLDLIELSIPIKVERGGPHAYQLNFDVHIPKVFVHLKRLRVLSLTPSSLYLQTRFPAAFGGMAHTDGPRSRSEEGYFVIRFIAEEAAHIYWSSASRNSSSPPTLEWITFGPIANADQSDCEPIATFRLKWKTRGSSELAAEGYYPEVEYVPDIHHVIREECLREIRLGETFVDSNYNCMKGESNILRSSQSRIC